MRIVDMLVKWENTGIALNGGWLDLQASHMWASWRINNRARELSKGNR